MGVDPGLWFGNFPIFQTKRVLCQLPKSDTSTCTKRSIHVDHGLSEQWKIRNGGLFQVHWKRHSFFLCVILHIFSQKFGLFEFSSLVRINRDPPVVFAFVWIAAALHLVPTCLCVRPGGVRALPVFVCLQISSVFVWVAQAAGQVCVWLPPACLDAAAHLEHLLVGPG